MSLLSDMARIAPESALTHARVGTAEEWSLRHRCALRKRHRDAEREMRGEA